MFKKLIKFKPLISILIILATILAAVYYLSNHENLLTNLTKISPFIIIFVLFLYILMLFVLVGVFHFTVRLLNVKLNLKDNILLNCYSIFMNFFVPGQTGPIYRGYYLKTKHKIRAIDFTLATAIYFAIYIIISVLFILFGSQSVVLASVASFIFILGIIFSVKVYLNKENSKLKISGRNITGLVFITIIQLFLQTMIYFIELHSVDKTVSLSSSLTYSGSAALTIFVSLTPGAIGIREGFLILTRHLSHLSNSTIILANIIDRSVFILYLLIIGLLILVFHINKRINLREKEKTLSQ